MAPQKSAPPTKVVPKTFLKNSDTPAGLFQIAYEVRADANSSDEGLREAALTDFKTEGGVTDDDGARALDENGNQRAFLFPGYTIGTKSGKKVVTALEGRFKMVFTLVIQTSYGPAATIEQPSGYGRGTTKPDIDAGDTSLGFHESCHRADYVEFLQKNALPTYRGRVGLTVEEFNGAGAAFVREFLAYFVRMRKFSDNRTDEVGYTWKEYEAKGPQKE
jgi:hypothetical protein